MKEERSRLLTRVLVYLWTLAYALELDTYCPLGTQTTPPPCSAGRQCIGQSTALALEYRLSPSILNGDKSFGVCIPCDLGQNCSLPGMVNEFARFCTLDSALVTCPGKSMCVSGSIYSAPTPVVVTNSSAGTVVLTGVCVPCHQGMLCPAGSVNPLGNIAKNQCPSGRFCPHPEVAQACPAGQFCTPGSPVPIKCEKLGTVCLENASMPELCPPGFYCPDTSLKIECPRTSLCREVRTEPLDLDMFLAFSSSSAFAIPTVLTMVLLIFCHVRCCFSCALLLYSKRNLKESTKISAIIKSTEMLNTILKSLSGDASDGYEFKGLKEHQQKVSIQFENLGLVIGKTNKSILSGVTGTFHHSRLIAVMGPSGSGKSVSMQTFLNVLTGKAYYGKMTGSVRINGKPAEIAKLKQNFGFVPQDDTVHEDLTVRENLMFSAMMRLPKEYSYQRRFHIVLDVIKILGLYGVQDSVVGSVEERGISGGQRKRVNIGIELVGDPDVLFLDEPTSGLDASASLEIIASLTDIARLGMTIITVIHQPRYSLFSLFDDVLLLGVGGKTVYIGSAEHAMEYFSKLGFVCPPAENPADFFLDIIAGHVPLPGHPEFEASDLPDFWRVANGEAEVANVEIPTITQAPQSIASGGGLIKDVIKAMASLSAESKELDLEEIDRDRDFYRDGTRTLSIVGPDVHGFSQQSRFHTATITAADLFGITPAQVTSVRRLFQQFDKNRNGFLDEAELQKLFLSLGKEVTLEETKRLLLDMNSSEKGVSLPDLLQKMGGIRSRLKKRAARDSVTEAGEIPALRVKRPLYVQWWLFYRRDFIKLIRHYQRAFFDIGIVVAAALIVGVFSGTGNKLIDMPRIGSFSNLTLGILATVFGLRWFMLERVTYWREMSGGLSRIAYIMAKVCIQLWEVIVHPFFFVVVFHNITLMEGSIRSLHFLYTSMFWACSGMGMLISTVVAPDKSLLVGSLTPLIIGAFLAGFKPSYGEAVPFSKFLMDMGFARWALEGFLSYAFRHLPSSVKPFAEEWFEVTGYDKNNFSNDCLALFISGVIFRFLCYFTLRFRYRGKQV